MTGTQNNSGLSKIKYYFSFTFISLLTLLRGGSLLGGPTAAMGLHGVGAPGSFRPAVWSSLRLCPHLNPSRRGITLSTSQPAEYGKGRERERAHLFLRVWPRRCPPKFKSQTQKPTWSHLAVKKTWKYGLNFIGPCTQRKKKIKQKSKLLLDNKGCSFCYCLQGENVKIWHHVQR